MRIARSSGNSAVPQLSSSRIPPCLSANHRSPPLHPPTPLCQYPAKLRLPALRLEPKRFQFAYGAPPSRRSNRLHWSAWHSVLESPSRYRRLRLHIPRTGSQGASTVPDVGRHIVSVERVAPAVQNLRYSKTRFIGGRGWFSRNRVFWPAYSLLGRPPRSNPQRRSPATLAAAAFNT